VDTGWLTFGAPRKTPDHLAGTTARFRGRSSPHRVRRGPASPALPQLAKVRMSPESISLFIKKEEKWILPCRLREAPSRFGVT
jgi:hypothetical protein